MQQKIKLTENDYVFKFGYIDVNDMNPMLVICIANDIVSEQLIDNGFFTFEKNNNVIDIEPIYNKKYVSVDRNRIHIIKNIYDRYHSWNNGERTHLCLIRKNFPTLYFSYNDNIFDKEKTIFDKIKSFFKI